MSTRGGDVATLGAALQAGLAHDGGLYLPALPLPRPTGAPSSLALPDVARWVLAPLFADEPLGAHLESICRAAFSFDAPTRQLTPVDGLLELFHGPTAAFKDFGARFLAECLARTRVPERTTTVLVATSGDTGAAVAAAFHGRPGFRVALLYPDGRVSPRQAHQLGAFGGNVTAWRVAGSFDDCQRMVKVAFADTELRGRLALTSANSISLGRLLPQVAYWAKAALDAETAGRAPVTFVVPTGNLGNAFACLMARELGLPIARVVLATNANRVLCELLANGRYSPAASIPTLANAMDVGAPSNVERLLAWWPNVTAEKAWLEAHWVSDAHISARIRSTWREHGYAPCPHTACGLEALARLRAGGLATPAIAAATAHPAKFDTIVEPLTGTPVEPPSTLVELLRRPAHAEPLAADDVALKRALLATV